MNNLIYFVIIFFSPEFIPGWWLAMTLCKIYVNLSVDNYYKKFYWGAGTTPVRFAQSSYCEII